MARRWALAIGAWLAAAALATAASIWAVDSLRSGLFGPSDAPLTEAEVAAESTAAPSPPPLPSTLPSTSPASAPPDTTRALSIEGGSLVASCADGRATIDSWIPGSGFEADHVLRGPAEAASLRFKARKGGGDVRLRVTCAAGVPQLTLTGDD
jgi:hypothetical protein